MEMNDEEMFKAASEYLNKYSVQAAIEYGDIDDLTIQIKWAFRNGIRYAMERMNNKGK